MPYTVPPDIEAAMSDIMSRLNDRYKTHPTAGSVEDSARIEDDNRISMLTALKALASDPSRSTAINAGVDAQMAMARQNAEDQSNAATGQMTMGAASRGMMGGSATGKARGQIAAGRDQSIRSAATSAEDWRQGVQDADAQYLTGALQSILAPTKEGQGAMSATLNGYQSNLGLGQQLQDVKQQQNQQLAASIGGFLSNTVAPTINGAFQVASARRDGDTMSAWDRFMQGS